MILHPQDAERFYRIWWPLLRYTNAKRGIIPDMAESPEQGPISLSDAFEIRKALWEDDSLREAFITENPARLPPEDLDIIASWQHRRAGRFFVFRYLKKYTIFLDEGSPPRAYGVLGIMSALEEIIGPYLPVLINTVLIPFEDKIIYDSLLSPYNVMFGSSMREGLKLSYRDAQEREGIITSLLPATGSASADETKESFTHRNNMVLSDFRKALYKSSLSPKMVEQHTANITAFSDYLIDQNPPCLLLDIDTRSVRNYLDDLEAKDRKGKITSFKRFIRFMFDSNRLHPETAWDIEDALKTYRK
ncbi:MAG: hypothetical protein L0229_15745 [Blastocatellia bacterium]|nr:hypothetical protein [Blastocatellia bacterium]